MKKKLKLMPRITTAASTFPYLELASLVVSTVELAEADDEVLEVLDPVGVAVEVRLEELVTVELEEEVALVGAGFWKGGEGSEVEAGLEPEEVESDVVEDPDAADPVAAEAAELTSLDTFEPEAVALEAVAEAEAEEEEDTVEFEISILSYEPVMSPYLYEVAPELASSMVTLLTDMV